MKTYANTSKTKKDRHMDVGALIERAMRMPRSVLFSERRRIESMLSDPRGQAKPDDHAWLAAVRAALEYGKMKQPRRKPDQLL